MTLKEQRTIVGYGIRMLHFSSKTSGSSKRGFIKRSYALIQLLCIVDLAMARGASGGIH